MPRTSTLCVVCSLFLDLEVGGGGGGGGPGRFLCRCTDLKKTYSLLRGGVSADLYDGVYAYILAQWSPPPPPPPLVVAYRGYIGIFTDYGE